MWLAKAKGFGSSETGMLIVADTSPLNYLILVQAAHVLPQLYGQILIPPEVLRELRDAAGPVVVRSWAADVPRWLEVRRAIEVDMTLPLDEGERAALALATQLGADRLLIDEREGRRIAVRMGIPIAGTLAVIRDAALAGLLDLKGTIDHLKQTSFRASPALFDEILADFETLMKTEQERSRGRRWKRRSRHGRGPREDES
jgi:predicted nucleic acid-binding protein